MSDAVRLHGGLTPCGRETRAAPAQRQVPSVPLFVSAATSWLTGSLPGTNEPGGGASLVTRGRPAGATPAA